MVELRARLSLLVDKTTFQYRALTIYYTTIGRHAPAITTTTTSASSRGGEGSALDAPVSLPAPTPQGKDGTHWTYRITTVPAAEVEGMPLTFWITPACTRAARSGREERDALDAPGSAPPHACQGRKKEGTTDAPGSPAPAAEVEGMPLTFWITPQRQHGTGTPSGVFKFYIFPSGFFYKNTNRRAGALQGVASGI